MAAANLITHSLGNKTIMQRPEDGYMNATAMCQATGKKLSHYTANESTTAFLNALASDAGIPASELIQIVRGGNGQQGTWVHPHVAIHLAQWLSPEFAVKVSRWVFEWMGQGKKPNPEFIMIHKSVLQDTGKALVWMGNYGLTSQPYYGGAQPPFIDGVPVNRLNDQSERYYLVRYIGNTLDSQYLATESAVTHHIHQQFPTLQVVNKNTMIENFGAIMHQLSEFSGMFSTFEESKSRFMQATAKF